MKKFGLSLNPKKSHFVVQEGKHLGHLVSAYGIRIDPKRVKAILKISLPISKKDVQSFIGKINFLRWVIPNFVETIKQITSMLRKDQEVKWIAEARASFEKIRQDLTEAPVLVSPEFSKDFWTFSFASWDTIAAVLLQKNKDGLEKPIAFFIKTLRDSELKYNILEKQAQSLVKALKFFRIYVLHSKVIAYVPNAAIKDVLTQPDSEEKRGKWIAKIMEYDVDIRPTKLVKGQGLAKLLAESNCQSLGLHLMAEQPAQEENQAELEKDKIMDFYSASTWYADIVYFILYLQCPDHLDKKDARYLKLKTTKYYLVEQQLVWKDLGGILLRCLDKTEIEGVISESHEGACGRHKYWKETTYKILRAGYYWPSLFSDVYQ